MHMHMRDALERTGPVKMPDNETPEQVNLAKTRHDQGEQLRWSWCCPVERPWL